MQELDAAFKTVLKRQYHSGLAMLRESIERCSDEVWLAADHLNAFWQIAYHTLYFTHMYLGSGEEAFRPWEHDQGSTQNPDGIAGPPDPNSALPLIPQPYARAQVLEYCQFCDRMVDGTVDDLDLQRSDCGFHWYHMSKLEHQLVNLRHLEHHTGQLADRLRAAENIGIRWVGGDKFAAA